MKMALELESLAKKRAHIKINRELQVFTCLVLGVYYKFITSVQSSCLQLLYLRRQRVVLN